MEPFCMVINFELIAKTILIFAGVVAAAIIYLLYLGFSVSEPGH